MISSPSINNEGSGLWGEGRRPWRASQWPWGEGRRPWGGRETRAGFSLFELVIVLIILGIWASIAVPRMGNSIAYHRAEAAATRIVRDLNLARARARSTSAGQSVIFDAAAGSYELVGVRDMDRSAETYRVWLGREPYRATMISASFGGEAEIVFDGYGVPSSDGTIVIQSGAYQKIITLDQETGEVSVK